MTNRVLCWTAGLLIAITVAHASGACALQTLWAHEPGQLSFQVQREVLYRELNPGFCWFHPRAAAIPGLGSNGGPALIVTLQKHLVASDHYSGMYFMRSDDLGKTWIRPMAIPELAWQYEGDGTLVSVADVTPGWHAPTKKLLLIGTRVRYDKSGAQLDDQPRSKECAYAWFDPQTGRWSTWKMLAMPPDARFDMVAAGCVQWLTTADGSLLVPVYFRTLASNRYSTTVLHCRFDGERLKYVNHGDELTVEQPRGLYEPSLAYFKGRYYLTLRNDVRGYVTTSSDALRFAPVKPWEFDDGTPLGSYNTQQHWLVHSGGLFLAYTRSGAKNDHIFRHRAPLFLAQVDPASLRVLRGTEQVLIRERGVPLGNFGAAAMTRNESLVTDAEFLVSGKAHPRGADGSVYAVRVRWSQPNELLAK